MSPAIEDVLAYLGQNVVMDGAIQSEFLSCYRSSDSLFVDVKFLDGGHVAGLLSVVSYLILFVFPVPIRNVRFFGASAHLDCTFKCSRIQLQTICCLLCDLGRLRSTSPCPLEGDIQCPLVPEACNGY